MSGDTFGVFILMLTWFFVGYVLAKLNKPERPTLKQIEAEARQWWFGLGILMGYAECMLILQKHKAIPEKTRKAISKEMCEKLKNHQQEKAKENK